MQPVRPDWAYRAFVSRLAFIRNVGRWFSVYREHVPALEWLLAFALMVIGAARVPTSPKILNMRYSRVMLLPYEDAVPSLLGVRKCVV